MQNIIDLLNELGLPLWAILFIVVVAAVLIYIGKHLFKILENTQNNSQVYENNRNLQVEAYYKQLSGTQISELFKDWTELMVDLRKVNSLGADGFNDLILRTIMYGSERTLKILSEYQQFNYHYDSKNASEMDKNKAVVFVSMIITSLKRDFSGEEIRFDTILKIKLNDFKSVESNLNKAFSEINQTKNNKLLTYSNFT